jgi:Helix-turn-helix domain
MPHDQSFPFGYPTAPGTGPAPGAWIPLRDAARRLGCSLSTALRLVQTGLLPASWHRGSWSVPVEAIDTFLAQHAPRGLADVCADPAIIAPPAPPQRAAGRLSPDGRAPLSDDGTEQQSPLPAPGTPSPCRAIPPRVGEGGPPLCGGGRGLGTAAPPRWEGSGPGGEVPPETGLDDPLLPILVSLGRLVDGGGTDPRRPSACRLLREIEGAAEQSLKSTKVLLEALGAWGRSIGAEAELVSLMQVESCVHALRKHVRTELCLGLAAERLLSSGPHGAHRAPEGA